MRGLSQEMLAELAGLSRNVVSNLERNEAGEVSANPTLKTIYQLAAALDVPPAILLPAAGERVTGMPRDVSLNVDIVWPASRTDVQPADVAFRSNRIAPATQGLPLTITLPQET